MDNSAKFEKRDFVSGLFLSCTVQSTGWITVRAVGIIGLMTSKMLRILAANRLHFGLLAFGGNREQRYGGAGMMIEQPGIEVRISQATRLTIVGVLGDRVRNVVRRWSDWSQVSPDPPCRIEVLSSPRMHVGLGVGTQLGLAIARGLNTFFNRPAAELPELAQSVGRGARSAVGALGFECGGLIAEQGKSASETLSKLQCRIELPGEWRAVLLCEPGEGLHGARETGAFAELPPIPAETTRQLALEMTQRMLPAAAAGQFDEFSESVYQYGHTSGRCFARIQGGAYNGKRAAHLTEAIRQLGFRGAGQSSWGPTVYALTADQAAAEHLVEQLRNAGNLESTEVIISPPNNSGARFEWMEDG